MLVRFRYFDWKLLAAAALLIAMGLAAIYSVDLSRGQEVIYFKKQLISAGIGLALFFLASLARPVFWRYLAKWWYGVAMILLASVLLFGSTIRGTRGWFSAFGFSFQPVELAKAGLIFILAYIISKFGRRFERPLFFFGTGLVTLILIVLVLLQPDLGSALLLGLLWFGMMWMMGAKRVYLLATVALVALVAVAGWSFALKDYQKARLLTFIDPSRDPLGAGYNITQSVIAVGAGKLYGRGLGFGSQSQLRFLPEAQTDFIFSVIGEELGLAGAAALLALFVVIFWRIAIFLRETKDDFAGAAAVGIFILFFSQFFVNVGAGIGLLPITGVTLPFVSYGGSSLIISMLLVGVLSSMASER